MNNGSSNKDGDGDGVFQIGFDDESSIRAKTSAIASVNEAIAEAETSYAEAKQRILDRVDFCIEECKSSWTECRECLMNSVDIQSIDLLNFVEKIRGSIQKKLDYSIRDSASLAVASMMSPAAGGTTTQTEPGQIPGQGYTPLPELPPRPNRPPDNATVFEWGLFCTQLEQYIQGTIGRLRDWLRVNGPIVVPGADDPCCTVRNFWDKFFQGISNDLLACELRTGTNITDRVSAYRDANLRECWQPGRCDPPAFPVNPPIGETPIQTPGIFNPPTDDIPGGSPPYNPPTDDLPIGDSTGGIKTTPPSATPPMCCPPCPTPTQLPGWQMPGPGVGQLNPNQVGQLPGGTGTISVTPIPPNTGQIVIIPPVIGKIESGGNPPAQNVIVNVPPCPPNSSPAPPNINVQVAANTITTTPPPEQPEGKIIVETIVPAPQVIVNLKTGEPENKLPGNLISTPPTQFTLSQFTAHCDPTEWKTADFPVWSSSKDSKARLDYLSQIFTQSAAEEYERRKTDSWIGANILWAFMSLSGGLFAILASLIGAIITLIPSPRNCSGFMWTMIGGMRAIFNFAGRWLGLVPDQIIETLDQKLNLVCQTGVLDSGSATSVYVAGGMNENEWKYCLHLNGDCDPWFQRVVDVSVNKITLDESIVAWRGKFLTSEQLEDSFRKAGINDLDYRQALIKIREAIPTLADLVPLMTRDVFDEEIVRKYNYDDGFTEKFTGIAEEWAERQGISKDVMRYYWRRHWELASPTQIYEFVRRFRPGANAKTPDGKPVVFTVDDARELLRTKDIAPGMVDYVLAASYRVPTNTDVQKFYELDVIDLEQAQKMYEDIGYTESDAKLRVKSLEKNSRQRRAIFSGELPIAEVDRLFRDDTLSDSDYRELLVAGGYDPNYVDQHISRKRIERDARDQKQIMAKARTAFLAGRLDDSEYRLELTNAGVDHERAGQIVSRDGSIKRNSNKRIAIAKLCKLVSQGYMDMSEYMRRAINLGFNQVDAALMAQSCDTDIRESRQKKLEADQRRALQEAEKAERKAKARAAAQRKWYKENFPCKPRAKIPCPPGITPEPEPMPT